MDENRLRDLLGTPLEAEPQRRWWPWLVAAVVVAIAAIAGTALLGDGAGDLAAEPVTPASSSTTSTVPAPAPWPEPRVFYELAYHPNTQLMVMFGGTSVTTQRRAGELIAETWLFDPATAEWSDRTTDAGPTGRTGHAFAYDGSSGLVVLFGGGSTPRICGVSGPCAEDPLGDTWVFDMETTTWAQRQPAVAPSARSGASMAFDAESGLLVLFGGGIRSDSSFVSLPLDDTWTYDATTDTWTELSPIASPPARAWHDMVYDPLSDRILMFGGGAPGMVDDLVWSFDTNTTTWEPLEGTGPSPRWGAAVAFDEESRRLVVAGGNGPVIRTIGTAGTATEIEYLDDIWVFDPQADAWESRELLDGVAYWISAAWDPVSDRVVTLVFGLVGSYDVETSTWGWQEPDPATG